MGSGRFNRQRFFTGSHGTTCQQVQTMKGQHRLTVQFRRSRIID
jgi:hypothetical protein